MLRRNMRRDRYDMDRIHDRVYGRGVSGVYDYGIGEG